MRVLDTLASSWAFSGEIDNIHRVGQKVKTKIALEFAILEKTKTMNFNINFYEKTKKERKSLLRLTSSNNRLCFTHYSYCSQLY